MMNLPPSLSGQESLPQEGFLLLAEDLRADDLPTLLEALSSRELVFLRDAGLTLDPALEQAARASGHELLEFRWPATDSANLDEATPAPTAESSAPSAQQQSLPALLAKHQARGEVLIYLSPRYPHRACSRLKLPGTLLSQFQQASACTVSLVIDRPSEQGLSLDKQEPEANHWVFSAPVYAGEALGKLLEEHLLAGEQAFSNRASFQVSLGYALLCGAKSHAEYTLKDSIDGSETSYDKLLAAALVFAKAIKEETQQERVGIVLPPGRAGMVANLAVVFAGKVPVNINFTAGPAAIESALRQANTDRLITADKFVRKTQSFPWPPNKQLILIERVLPQLKSKIARTYLLNRLLPASWIAKLHGIEQQGGEREAVLLFTSGSSGEPKGVALTHRNVMGNVTQIALALGLQGADEKILGSLPLFHSFGATVTLWFPIIHGLGLVNYPNPTEVTKLTTVIAESKPALVVTTPTFLRGFLKRAKPEQLASIKLMVTGAEKLPPSLAQAFEEKFAKPVLEGYGLTETTPVTNVNLPAPADSELAAIPSHRPGSVGQLIPGMAVRITEVEGEQGLSVLDRGMIWLRGVNVFGGYLNNKAKSREVLNDGWFRTGDIGRVDEDGFLYIEGRLSRFSKIGGEMVPHEKVEEEIAKALGLTESEEPMLVVVGVPDEDKGEALVLLSTVAGETINQELIDLRYRLLEAGIPSLWIPKKMIPAREIPVLASGKINLQACLELAKLA